MKKILISLLVISFIFPSALAFGEETETPAGVSVSEFLFDDCADLSKVSAHSEGIYPSTIEAENQYAFDEDFTVFMRREATAEWITYEIPAQKYLVFYTYFRQGESISDFTFEASVDGTDWEPIRPIIQRREVDSWKWIPVTYSLKNMEEDFAYIKITFQNIGGTEWSPCISSVDAQYRKIEGIGFADCTNTPYQSATERLKNLHLINGYSEQEFAPENPVTRAEYVKMISSLLNITNLAVYDRDVHYFKDLPDTHWASPYIYTLYGMGIVNGDEEKRFHPEEQITLQDAVKILVAALGYDLQARESGGYPFGYTQAASQLSILQGISASYEEHINRGIAALLIDNALQVPYIYQTQFGEHNIFQYDGSTVLEKLHGIYTEEGIITDVGVRSVYAGHHLAENIIAMEDVYYEKPDFDMRDFLGVNTKLYYKAEHSGAFHKEIVYAQKNRSEIITLFSKDILQYADGKLRYEDASGREMVKNFHPNTRVLYNGRYDTRVGIMDELPLSCGKLTIIQNGNDHENDILRIEDYQTYLSQTKGRLMDGVQDRYLGLQNLELTNAQEIKLTVDGENVPYADDTILEQDSILQIARSRDGLCAELYVTHDVFTAQISSVHQQSGEFIIEDHVYSASPYLKTHHPETISPGNYKIYLDKDKQIVELSPASDVYQYGYLLGVVSRDPFDAEGVMRIATEDGIKALQLTDRTRYNGGRMKLDLIKALSPQLIQYRCNAEDELLGFYTASDALGYVHEDGFSLNYQAENCKYYGENLKVFSSIYQLSQDTKVFFIPSDITNTEQIKVRTYEALYTDYSYHVQLYDVSRDYVAGAAVIFEDGSIKRQVGSYDPVLIVDEAMSSLDENGDPILVLKGYSGGSPAELYFSTKGARDLTSTWLTGQTPRNTEYGAIDDFARGEILQYYTENGVCESFRLLCTQDMLISDAFYEKNLGDYGGLSPERYYSELYTIYGSVYQKFSNKLFVTADGGLSKRTVSLTDAPILLYDRAQNKLMPGSSADISAGDNIFVRLYYTGTKEILIVK